MNVLEARDCIFKGIGTDSLSSKLLSAMPMADRAWAMKWISDHLNIEKMKETEYGAVEDLLQDTMNNEMTQLWIHDSSSKMGKVFAVLQELRNLVLHGCNKVANA